MNKNFNRYLVILGILALILANSALSFAQDTVDFEGTQSTTQPSIQPTTDPVEEPTNTISAAEKQQIFLNRVREELNLNKASYYQLLNSISDTKNHLDRVNNDKITLQGELMNLDDLINLSTDKLFSVIAQIVETENEIALLYEKIDIKQIAIDYQKNLLKDYIKIIYEQENAYFSIDKNGEIDAFKLLLADNTIGENLNELKSFDLLNEAGQQMIDNLEVLTTELESSQKQLNTKKQNLIALQNNLDEEKRQLEFQKAAKQNLLDLTFGQEEVFGQLLEQSLKEQESLINDIKNLSNAVAFIEQKIAEEGDNFDPDKYLSLLDYKTQALYQFHLETPTLINGFMWPADPDRGISAYFRDPSYINVFGVQHNAVDIPLYQGSPIRAAADGVVYSAKDNDYGYSYIVLAHADGFTTVYGHISNILVEEGQTIAQGSILGLSGGMPGTKGAGYMTTGPHLHFEMLLNGLYVDPLDYLSLAKLTKDQVEDNLPEKYYDEWEEDVREDLTMPIAP